MLWIMAVAVLASAQTVESQFGEGQCRGFKVSTGGEKGPEGVIRHCDNGKDQMVYLSGDLDTPSDRKSLLSVIRRIQKRTSGRFHIVTKYAGGGEVDWHQDLMVAIEDACSGECRIETRVIGPCYSACNQLHLTCAKGATTFVEPDGKLCEHASLGEAGDKDCSKCDPKDPSNCRVCGPKESIREYTMRCDELLKGRKVQVDPEKKRMIETHAKKLANMGAFDTSNWTCLLPPWANPSGTSASNPGQTTQ